MITEAIFAVFRALLQIPLLLLPEWDPIDLSGAAEAIADLPIASWVRWFDYYLPVSHGLVALGLLLAVGAAAYAFDWLVWILARVHVLGAGGD